MNLLYFFPYHFKLEIKNNVDINKLVKSIKFISKSNAFIKCIKNPSMFDYNVGFDANVYFWIEHNVLNIKFCHLYYDGYSIFYILKQIDLIYTNYNDKNKIVIKQYKCEYEFYKLMQIAITSITHINFNALNIINVHKLKVMRIKKTDVKSLSNIDIIIYVLKKLQINKFSLIVNLRKIFVEKNNTMGNFVYYINEIEPNEIDIRQKLKEQSNYELNDLLANIIPTNTLVNSYLGFKLPSFIKKINDLHSMNNYIFICPANTSDKYYIIYYNL